MKTKNEEIEPLAQAACSTFRADTPLTDAIREEHCGPWETRGENLCRAMIRHANELERKLQQETARLDQLEKLVNFGVWQGSWAEHMGEKAGRRIVDINEMCDGGQEVVGHFARGETLREAIDAYMANTKAAHAGTGGAGGSKEKL